MPEWKKRLELRSKEREKKVTSLICEQNCGNKNCGKLDMCAAFSLRMV